MVSHKNARGAPACPVPATFVDTVHGVAAALLDLVEKQFRRVSAGAPKIGFTLVRATRIATTEESYATQRGLEPAAEGEAG